MNGLHFRKSHSHLSSRGFRYARRTWAKTLEWPAKVYTPRECGFCGRHVVGAQYLFIEALNRNTFIREGNNSERGLERGIVELLETEGVF